MICRQDDLLCSRGSRHHDAIAKDQIQIAGNESHAIKSNRDDVPSTRENAMTECN